ncbi:MAG TPA: adenosylmethionine--8-amino-7-oxononanoate transaminase [Bacteroidia bacterium]|nr:adenosylmethionine--8-amino-7-oxononanoate transaminase [Bacteroidia bacterium]
MNENKSSLSDRDLISIWHPFTPQLNREAPVAIVRGEGTLLFDEEGNSYIDAISSWWVNLHGHSNSYIAEKISLQMKTLEHAIFSGYTHQPAIKLAERLLGYFPDKKKVFYSDDGSTSVEVALKMAFQYWHNQGKSKTKIIAFENAYHGDTFGGMSVGARNVFNNAFEKMLFDVIHIPVPVKGEEEKSFRAMSDALKSNDVAAFIFEPLVQGAGGMVMYAPTALDELIAKCEMENVITIADEVMTGFGRTGKFFATDYCTRKPDIICLSKGLTGGFLPLGVTICTEKIHKAFLTSDKTKTFFHGHSYTANPIACTAALASLDLLEKKECQDQIGKISVVMKNACDKFSESNKIKDARSLGTILALEIKTAEATEYLNPLAELVHQFFPKRGIILRPLGNILYVLPPYCITEEELNKVLNTIEEFLLQC